MKSRHRYFSGVCVSAFGVVLSLCAARQPVEKRSSDFTPNVEQHVVTAGESLWSICGKVTGKPWVWSRVWAMNPHLTNPHWVHAGEVVYFVSKSERLLASKNERSAAGEIRHATDSEIERARRGPKVEVIATRRGADTETKIWRHVNNTTFVTADEMEQAGKLTNAAPDRVMLSQGDTVFLTFPKNRAPEVGSHFLLYRPLRSVRHPITEKRFGYLAEATGILTVQSVDGQVAEARVDRSIREIERGQLVTPLKSSADVFLDVKSTASESEVRGVVVAIENDVVSAGAHKIVFIDKGERDGLKRGNQLKVKSSGKSAFADKPIHPGSLDFASLVVVDVRDTSSACLVTNASHEVVPGDVVYTKN